MDVQNALVNQDGCLIHQNTCYICEKQINWYVKISGTCIEPNKRELAEMIVNDAKLVSGINEWVEFSIVVKCPTCRIKNRFDGLKWKIK